MVAPILGLPGTPLARLDDEDRPPAGAGKTLTVGSLPLSERAQATLEQSLREAVRRDDAHLGGEHILLALLREPGGGAVRTLHDLGIAPERIEQSLEAALVTGSFAPAG